MSGFLLYMNALYYTWHEKPKKKKGYKCICIFFTNGKKKISVLFNCLGASNLVCVCEWKQPLHTGKPSTEDQCNCYAEQSFMCRIEPICILEQLDFPLAWLVSKLSLLCYHKRREASVQLRYWHLQHGLVSFSSIWFESKYLGLKINLPVCIHLNIWTDQ